MRYPPVFVKKIQQESQDSFSIVWSDDTLDIYYLADLQQRCPCAACTVKEKKDKAATPVETKEKINAISIKNVGRYALKIQFTTGCSKGIYGFELLRYGIKND